MKETPPVTATAAAFELETQKKVYPTKSPKFCDIGTTVTKSEHQNHVGSRLNKRQIIHIVLFFAVKSVIFVGIALVSTMESHWQFILECYWHLDP